MADTPVTTDMLIVFGALALVIVLFVFEWVRVDVVGLLMMTILFGLVTLAVMKLVGGIAG